MDFHVGTSGYSYKEWKGSFYPEKLPAKEMLGYYAQRFRTVEINNTFYRMPEPSVLEAWANQVPGHFRFVLKAPQDITHRKRLKDAGELVAALVASTAVLKERLGPLLFQLPPNFGKDVPRLRDFLALVPKGTRVAFEFRHAAWFDDEVFGLLRDRGAALCVADADDDLEVPFVATADWGYLRLRRAAYDAKTLATWAKRIRDQKWTDAFVFFKHEDAGTGPRFAAGLLESLAEDAGAKAKRKKSA
jgi:uncharacterized protein YecE (DUF72 family)